MWEKFLLINFDDHSKNYFIGGLLVAKKIKKIAKLEIEACKAKPGPALASLGINMMGFCTQFNEATKTRANDIVPVLITAYDDKSFDFILKTTPTSILLKKAAKIAKGAKNSVTEKVATLTKEDIKKIAEYKLPDLNANSIDKAMKIIEGTARNMGIHVEGSVFVRKGANK